MGELLTFSRVRGMVVAVALVALTCAAAFAMGAPRIAGVIGAAGSVLSIASAWLVWQACARTNARALADDARAASLQHALDDSRAALELAEIGTWQWDLRTHRISYSPGCARMLGYRGGEIDDALSAWGKLVHPEDLAPVREAVDALVEDRVDHYEARVRLKGADGRWHVVLDRGRIVARDDAGRPTAAIGVHMRLGAEGPVAAPAVRTRGRWLIVDDDDSVRRVLEVAARRAGLDVIGFADPRAAWAAICEGGAPLGIVTDFEMPGMTGVQLAERVRAAGLECPVLLVTGNAGTAIGECRSIDAMLIKPFTVAELVPWLTRHSAGRVRAKA